MSRAPFQVLVFPYRLVSNKQVFYGLFRRELSTGGYWQGIAGGGEIGETPLEAAKRESFEEAGIKDNSEYIQLDCYSMIPVVNVCGFKWGKDVLVIPEYSFGVEVKNDQIKLSDEHIEFRWLNYADMRKKLKWDSNKNALWELDYRIKKQNVKLHKFLITPFDIN